MMMVDDVATALPLRHIDYAIADIGGHTPLAILLPILARYATLRCVVTLRC